MPGAWTVTALARYRADTDTRRRWQLASPAAGTGGWLPPGASPGAPANPPSTVGSLSSEATTSSVLYHLGLLARHHCEPEGQTMSSTLTRSVAGLALLAARPQAAAPPQRILPPRS